MPAGLLGILLANLPGLIKGIEEGYQMIVAERARAQQTGEWTADQENQFQAVEAARAGQPWQQPQG